MHAEAGEGPLESFWRNARRHAHLEASVPVYFGQGALELVLPPVWSFGASPEQADALLELVLEGVKTATASAAWDYEVEAEPLPKVDELGIVTDSGGRPRALLRTTAVQVCPFDQVDAEHALLEGEGDGSLAYWRRVHEAFFTEHAAAGHRFSPQMPVVLERFELLYSA